MAAAYAPIPTAASPDEEAKGDLSSSQASDSTNASPTPFLSLAGAAFTPLSMSVGSADMMQYPPDDDLLDQSEKKNMKSLQEEGLLAALNTPSAAPDTTQPTTITTGDRNAVVVDAAKHKVHAPAARNGQEIGAQAEREREASAPLARASSASASALTESDSPLHPPPAEEAQAAPSQPSREDDGAEITSISRTTGHAGSTPLGIPALLNFSSSRGKANNISKILEANAAAAASSSSSASPPAAETHNTSSNNTTPFPPVSTLLDTSPPPSHSSHIPSPTSLIDQLHETIQRSSTSSSPAAAATSAALHRPQPIVRTTSDSTRFTVRHPAPDLNHRSGAYVGNIAVLEKTAERLSMTSSIEDAIRDLHGELKRSDSRRSSILAASVRGDTASPDDSFAAASQTAPQPQPPSLARHLSSASNIVEVNNAARNGGYSPAAYVMSPNHSLTSRLRSGSKNSTGRPDFDVDVFMSRQGPGKGSTRSVRSTKMSLAEIAESEPTALNSEALDNADKMSVKAAKTGDDAAASSSPRGVHEQTAQQKEPDTPTTDAFHQMLDEGSLHRPSKDYGIDFDREYTRAEQDAAVQQQDYRQQQPQQQFEDDRPGTPRSTTSTFDANNAFGDFDGVHCEPDFDFASMPEPQMPAPRRDMAPPRRETMRPQSYFDMDSGQQMLYYPARVPAMLNLPPKLSRKPKAAVRNARHSRVLQAMGHLGTEQQPEYMHRNSHAPPARESTMWLPDPVETEAFSPFAQDAPVEQLQQQPYDDRSPGQEARDPMGYPDNQGLSPHMMTDGMPQPPPPARQRSPRNDIDSSEFPNKDLPPHLRASAFFDLPSAAPQVEAKGGSAMAALDDILNASASAPVDAFTDHVFAGKLGNEVYGRAKKKNRKSAANMLQAGDAGPSVVRKRSSNMALNQGAAADEEDQRRNTITGSVRSGRGRELGDGEESQALSGSIDGDRQQRRNSQDEEEDESDDEEEEFQGPPTTLLAELQLRKQRQKQRTKNIHAAAPGGMHSTLLELDAVAEAQRRNRNARRVNLAWEDPALGGQNDDSEDEDVPLGVLYAAKANGNNDISAAVVELNRPIGLMERREMEDNEPLSARRARLTGIEPMTLANRRSMMTLNPNMRSATRLSGLPPPQRSPTMLNVDMNGPLRQDDGEPEIEEESLGERMRRLRAKEEAEHNNLPRARPVSGTFSNELLSQFGDLEEKTPDAGPKEPPTGEGEEGETLGQRRKRLQGEREARLREMSMNALTGGAQDARPPMARRRVSLADTLGAFPVREHHDAMAAEHERRVLEEQRRVRDQEEKMAAMRAQMPQTLLTPTAGTKAGGFRGGSYNDGLGGGVGYPAVSDPTRASIAFTGYGAPMNGYGAAQAYGVAPGYGQGYGQGYAAAPMQMGMQQMGGMPMNSMGMNMNMGMQMPMQMPMAGQRGQLDSIERWRQSVMQ